MATDLYHRVLTFDHGDEERNELVKRVWSGTPWMVDAYTDSINSERDRAIVEWCREQFGPEAWPIHGHPGSWHRGSATIHGWTWIGFDSEDNLRQFEAAWPAPKDEIEEEAPYVVRTLRKTREALARQSPAARANLAGRFKVG